MRAVIYDRNAPTGLGHRTDMPKPQAAKGEVLIKVKAVALNPVDYKLPHLPFMARRLQGSPVGLDLAGVVEAVGPGAESLKVGDEVFGNTWGSMAEFVSVPAAKVTKKPTKLSWTEAAALPTVALTSYQALVKAGVKEGSRVLVLGGSGGCGAMGVQIGKAMGAHVTSNCSGKNIEAVKGHGADVVIDYTKEEIPAEPKFDCIYDTVTSPDDVNYQPLIKTHLQKAGQYVAINGFAGQWLKHFLLRWAVNSPLVVTNHSAEDLAKISEWVDQGAVRSQVQEVIPFSEEGVAKAFDMLKSRRATGKLVVAVSE